MGSLRVGFLRIGGSVTHAVGPYRRAAERIADVVDKPPSHARQWGGGVGSARIGLLRESGTRRLRTSARTDRCGRRRSSASAASCCRRSCGWRYGRRLPAAEIEGGCQCGSAATAATALGWRVGAHDHGEGRRARGRGVRRQSADRDLSPRGRRDAAKHAVVDVAVVFRRAEAAAAGRRWCSRRNDARARRRHGRLTQRDVLRCLGGHSILLRLSTIILFRGHHRRRRISMRVGRHDAKGRGRFGARRRIGGCRSDRHRGRRPVELKRNTRRCVAMRIGGYGVNCCAGWRRRIRPTCIRRKPIRPIIPPGHQRRPWAVSRSGSLP